MSKCALALTPLDLFMPIVAQASTSGDVSAPFLNLALGLAVCTALALAAALLIRRYLLGKSVRNWLLPGPPAERVAILESRRISAHADVCRIASTDAEYLVLVGPGVATVLEAKPRPQRVGTDTGS